MKPVDISNILLARPFSFHTDISWYDYVLSLKEQRIEKLPRIRMKLPPKLHSVNKDSGLCETCGRKPRNPIAKCTSPKKKIDSNSNYANNTIA